MSFKIAVHQMPLIPPGKTRVTAVVNIKNESDGAVGGGVVKRFAALVGDISGSMRDLMPDLRQAMSAWVDVLEDGVEFTVFVFASSVTQVYPQSNVKRSATASSATRAEAKERISRIGNGGDTFMDMPIAEVCSVAKTLPGYISHCTFLTDGDNHSEESSLRLRVNAAKGVFQCDVRILGDGSNVARMRDQIATPLLGQVKVIKSAGEMAQEFQETLRKAMGKSAGDVVLKLRCPFKTVGIESVTETVPQKLDLQAVLDPSDPERRTWLFRTAPWEANEDRDYLVVVQVQALPGMDTQKASQLIANLTAEGREMPEAAIPAVCWKEAGVDRSVEGDKIRIAFTGSAEKSSVYVAANMDSVMRVAFATGQVELVEARQQLAEAARSGDVETVTRLAKKVIAVVEKTGDPDLIADEVTRVGKLGVKVADDREADGTRRVVVRKVDKLTADDFDAGTTQTKKFVKK